MSERGRPRTFDRNAALRRAMDVFWAKGYEGASISDLAAAMGINSPSLYAAYGSKEALFLEATDLYSRVEGADIWLALEEAPTARLAIERFLRRTAKAYSQTDRPQGCLIALGALHEDSSRGAICADLRRRRAENLTALKKRLERGVAEGELPADFNCRAAATFFATVQHGMSIQARDGASRAALLATVAGAMAAWKTMADTAEA
ncbi:MULTISPECIES: TetR/AcrR family transcriptional regulator [unclassified Mesorhizobium]|uniref:TetR/AcrR family transcriptional regulator n=1 Tax=unclassified Mesorhizobium TaxID=325217 RepID=UPI000FD24201|nr:MULTISPECIES: TetR/AcrR family transcriptional regulator [unclassified Mesorhizobium]RVD45151.1 TetR/AcrR family transcriptional regulator [Mesorhizobium sp. M8A.F.Ca.ET.023.02.2.1]TGV61646.1 TetR/AcrR family transcriptional regulator [bacterium M00.F.Ca.ET.141.01.1.1]RWC76124.1 MAG: TetR/AcrR family transcriptional regulator [Mesorhizobium sp.]RWC92017.1 MAG: TetR/AcrR family transcriptional regulator [Mesorhizobium sp.]TGP94016.1 TetR/AcrR family transcriptional regulator [Mesorhizobium s